MKKYNNFISENKASILFKVTYDGRYAKRFWADSKEEAIKKADNTKTMKNKKKIMKFDPKKYSVEIIDKLEKSIGMG